MRVSAERAQQLVDAAGFTSWLYRHARFDVPEAAQALHSTTFGALMMHRLYLVAEALSRGFSVLLTDADSHFVSRPVLIAR